MKSVSGDDQCTVNYEPPPRSGQARLGGLGDDLVGRGLVPIFDNMHRASAADANPQLRRSSKLY